MAKKEPRIERIEMAESDNVVHLVGMDKLTKDLQATAGTMGRTEAGYLVSMYYTIQTDRQRMSSQLMELQKRGEPHKLVQFSRDQFLAQEEAIKLALDVWTRNTIMGQWARQIIGIGPVLAAGLDAWVNLENCRTAGDLWSFAGLNPMSKWLGAAKSKKVVALIKMKHGVKSFGSLSIDGRRAFLSECAKEMGLANNPHPRGEHGTVDGAGRLLQRMGKEKWTEAALVKAMSKRPWNGELKTLCWKIGESFKNFSGREDSLYGQLYLQRKAYEWEKNLNGDYSDQAAAKAEIVAKTTKAHLWNTGRFSAGHVRTAMVNGVLLSTLDPDITPLLDDDKGTAMLSPGHIMERSKRWATKLFLAHYHHVGWVRVLGKEPVNPYPMDQLGHAHVIGPERAA